MFLYPEYFSVCVHLKDKDILLHNQSKMIQAEKTEIDSVILSAAIFKLHQMSQWCTFQLFSPACDLTHEHAFLCLVSSVSRRCLQRCLSLKKKKKRKEKKLQTMDKHGGKNWEQGDLSRWRRGHRQVFGSGIHEQVRYWGVAEEVFSVAGTFSLVGQHHPEKLE